MVKLLQANCINLAALTLGRKTVTPVTVDLIEGEVDACVFASALESLRQMEDVVGKRPADKLLAELLKDIETRLDGVTGPLSDADELASLRGHIQMVGNRLRGPALAVAAGK